MTFSVFHAPVKWFIPLAALLRPVKSFGKSSWADQALSVWSGVSVPQLTVIVLEELICADRPRESYATAVMVCVPTLSAEAA